MQAEAPSSLRLGPFKVATQREEVAAFARETGWFVDADQEIAVPHTFPMRWLSLPAIHDALAARLDEAGGIAVHEAQSFAYARQLAADRDYVMEAGLEQQANPPRLVLHVKIATPDGVPCLEIETVLRIISATAPSPVS